MESLPLGAKTTRAKSPNAPSYSLQECLEDTRKVFRIENQVATSRESIAEHIVLAPQSGPFNRKLSSLRQYGLLEAIGKDLRVSDLFIRIEHATGETERCRALREALGRPTVFQRLLSQYEQTGLPSDINLTNQLIIKHRFTKKNAEVVSRAFLDSSRFAGLGLLRLQIAPPPLPPQATRPAAEEALMLAPPLPSQPPSPPFQAMTDPSLCRQEIPLGTGRRAVVELPEDIKPEEIQRLMRILQALADPIA